MATITQMRPKSGNQEWIPTRRSLLSRLKDSTNDQSWKIFFDTYWRLIYNTARRAGLADAEAQDVVQETVISVLKSMPTFKYEPEKGTFKGWLLQITRCRIADHNRKVYSDRRLINYDKKSGRKPDETATTERAPDPNGTGFEKIWDEEWEANVMEAALNRIKNKIDLKQFQVFELYVVQGWKPLDVARTLKVGIGFVYLTKHKVQRLLKREIAKVQMKL